MLATGTEKKPKSYGNLKRRTSPRKRPYVPTKEEILAFMDELQLKKTPLLAALFKLPELFYRTLRHLSHGDIGNLLLLINDPEKRNNLLYEYWRHYVSQSDLYVLPDNIPLDEQGKGFFQEILLQLNLLTEALPHLDWLKPISRQAESENENRDQVFLPLLFLFQTDQHEFLSKIYEQQIACCKTINAVTSDSHQTFGFDLKFGLQDYLTENGFPENEPIAVAFMNAYLQTIWAICTYQPIEIFTLHAEDLEKIKAEETDLPIDEVYVMFLLYACYCEYHALVKHLCAKTSYHCMDQVLSGEPEQVVNCLSLIADNGGFGEKGYDASGIITTLKGNKSAFWSEEKLETTEALNQITKIIDNFVPRR